MKDPCEGSLLGSYFVPPPRLGKIVFSIRELHISSKRFTAPRFGEGAEVGEREGRGREGTDGGEGRERRHFRAVLCEAHSTRVTAYEYKRVISSV